MKKVAVMCAAGFEAGETLLVADVLRWGGIQANLITLKEEVVVGMHNLTAVTDRSFGEDAEALKDRMQYARTKQSAL